MGKHTKPRDPAMNVKRCKYCREVGHYYLTCPKKKADDEAMPANTPSQVMATIPQTKSQYVRVEAQRESMVPEMPKLPNRYFLLCENLLAGMSGGEAYLAAGFDCKKTSAQANASKALRRDDVRLYLTLRRRQIMEKADCSLEWWVKHNMAIAMETHSLKETPASRSAAVERLGRYLGAYQKDRQNEMDKRPTDELLADLPKALKVLEGGKLDESDRKMISAAKGLKKS